MYYTLSVEHADDDANWNHDSFTEFLADYRRFANKATYTAQASTYYLSVAADYMYIKGTLTYAKSASVTVRGPSRAEIEEIFAVFEESASAARLPEPPATCYDSRR